MNIVIIAACIVLGFVFLIIELFLIPGFSVPGLAGLALIGYGVFKAKVVYGMAGALYTLLLSLAAAAVLVRVAVKSRAAARMQLDYNEKDAVAVDDHSALVGKTGTTVTNLRPSRIAMIDNVRYDVIADGAFIDAGKPVVVEAVEGARIVVGEIEKKAE